MAANPTDRHSLLQDESNDRETSSSSAPVLPEITLTSMPNESMPIQRHGYQRMGSQDLSDPAPRYQSPVNAPSDGDLGSRGLGILDVPTRSIGSITRKPIGAPKANPSPPTPSNPFFQSPENRSPENRTPETRSPLSPNTPNTPSSTSSRTPLSPPWQRYESKNGAKEGLRAVTEVDEDSIGKGKMNSSFREELLNTPNDFNNNEDQSFRAGGHDSNDHELYDENINLLDGCPSNHNIHRHRTSWLSMSILFLSIYSTVFSGIYLVVALVAPRYGHKITSKGHGSINISTASTLFALFAKTIELSFVSVFVAFLGQVLSRRSLMKTERGVSIAEMTMRSWVIQPGSMITHWQNLRYAGLSILGMITLTAALVAMLYTTASDALVSPNLKFGRVVDRQMVGLVKMSYANVAQVAANCQTPISVKTDPDYSGTTCLQLQNAGQAYHNSIAFLGTWSGISDIGGTSSNITERPPVPAMMYDNTTVTGSWVFTNYSDIKASYDKYRRVVNNVSLSMPHAGVFAAARHQDNSILQPDDLGGIGQYVLQASVPSPSVNVLCVNAMESELDPIIWARFPNSNMNESHLAYNVSPPSDWKDSAQLADGKPFLNSTALDDIFEWGEKYKRQPPIFPMYPSDYNSIINGSGGPYGRDAYLLIKAPKATTTNYTLCQLRSFLSPDCSTIYNVTGSTAGHLHSNCDDPADKYTYIKSLTNATLMRAPDWRDLANEWMGSLTLNNGIDTANASNARLLSQLIVAEPSFGDIKLSPAQPSIAEQMAALAGNTLLASSIGSPFVPFWNYSSTILEQEVPQYFNASIRSQQYASGFGQRWEASFYIVLFLVFATNVFCLIYFFVYSGLVTDFTEQQNLFALAINSPHAKRLAGSCGAGPKREQMVINWHVRESGGHFYWRDGGGGISPQEFDVKQRERRTLKSQTSYNMLSSKRTSWL